MTEVSKGESSMSSLVESRMTGDNIQLEEIHYKKV